jgi:hypothetical protein
LRATPQVHGESESAPREMLRKLSMTQYAIG